MNDNMEFVTSTLIFLLFIITFVGILFLTVKALTEKNERKEAQRKDKKVKKED